MSKKEIPPEDKIVLSPLDQYVIYGKFPYFMIIHIVLLVLNTLQVTIILSGFNEYFRAQEKSFINALISDSPKEARDYPKVKYLYTIQELKEHIKDSVEKMRNIGQTFFNNITYVHENGTEYEAGFFKMEVEYKSNLTEMKQEDYNITLKKTYSISEDDLGPFSYEEEDIKKYIDSIYLFSIEYNLKIYFTRYFKEYQDCFIWNIIQTYDFTRSAHFTVSLLISNLQCEEKTTISKGLRIMISHIWIEFIFLAVALISAILCLRSFYVTNKLKKYRASLIEQQKGKKIKNPKILKEIETIGKVSMRWELILIFANLFQILGTLSSLLKQEDMNYSSNLVIAIGAFLCYISVGKYVDYDSTLALFFRSLKNLWPLFFPFVFATIPLFIAFTLVGLCLFWNSERFTNLSDVVMDLFALFMGDAIYDITSDLTDKDKLLAVIYCYLYDIIFIVVAMNVFNSIVQAAFVQAKFDQKSNWIYNSLMKRSHEVTNENLKNLPEIETMTPDEITEEMLKRISSMNDGLNKCVEIIQDIDYKKIDIESKTSLKKIIYRKVEEIDKKFEFIKLAWKNA
jgi:hypothetical protein